MSTMPVETMIVVAAVVASFSFFAVVVARASYQTDKILRAREAGRQ